MLQAIAELVFEVIGQIVCCVTGEVILWVVTLGRRKPLEKENNTDWSMFVGIIFWALIVVAVALLFIL